MDIHAIIEKQKNEINRLYDNYISSLEEHESSGLDFEHAHSAAEKFFNYLENQTAHNNSLEEIKSSDWNQWLAETCHDALELLVAHYIIYRQCKSAPNASPSKTAFAGMHRMVKKYYSKSDTKKLRKLLSDNNLPTYGFDNKAKVSFMKKGLSALMILAAFLILLPSYLISGTVPIPLVIGVVISCVVFIFCLFVRKPTGLQYFIIRALFSVSIPGLLVCYPGFIELTFNKFGVEVTAIGLLAIFVMIYSVNPAKLSELDS
ncbi:hypothetical protein ACE38U_08610 [Cedecea sp. S5-13]|uniref:hypothetical protein n=1 Tax=Cedecea selenatireducens TaxID=3144416 RepID=UPI0035CCE702